MIGLSGAVAVCALAVPGLSGSFVLVASGLILGSLRALRSWQNDNLLSAPPADGWTGALLTFLIGAAIVLLLWELIGAHP